MGGPALVLLDRWRLHDAATHGVLDSKTVEWAISTMEACGIADGFPVIILDGALFEPAWRWQRSAPQALAPSTRLRYMRDVRRLLEHFSDRAIAFEDLTGTDLRGYEQRRRLETTEATWSTEEAALMSLFRFCAEGDGSGWRLFGHNPWPTWRTARGERSALRRAPDTLTPMPRFLDDEELRFFLLAGIQGVHPDTGAPLEEAWPVPPPLVPERDLALASLMVSTGARMSEARLVLVDEIPTDPGRHGWPSVWLRLGGERAKTRGGEVPFDPEVGRLIGRWLRSPARSAMVDSAQGRLSDLRRSGRLFVVEHTAKDGKGEVTWQGQWLGRRRRFTTTTIPRQAAQHAVRVDSHGRIEPLTLWQGWRSGGAPISPDTVEEIFKDASRRAAAHPDCPFSDYLRPTVTTDKDGRLRARGGVSAHMLRHSAAVRWMVELDQELRRRRDGRGQRRPGLPPGSFNSLLMVQAWLRHRRYSTTARYQTCYLSRRWIERALGESLRTALQATGRP